MVQALPPNGPYHPLDIRPLLRRSYRSQYFLDAKFFQLFREVRTEDAVAVPQ